MTIPAQPHQILRFIILPIQIAMMHDQHPGIIDPACHTPGHRARTLQQSPVGGLAGNPVCRILTTTPMLILPGTMARNRTEKFSAARTFEIFWRAINLLTAMIARHPAPIDLRFCLAFFRAEFSPPLLSMPALYQHLFAANRTLLPDHADIIPRPEPDVK